MFSIFSHFHHPHKHTETTPKSPIDLTKKSKIEIHKMTHAEATHLCTRTVIENKDDKNVMKEKCRKIRQEFFGKEFSKPCRTLPKSLLDNIIGGYNVIRI